jgi:hypothetical protein
MAAGPGIALRYYFREDHYHTPRSYLDWTAQYRFAIGGGASDRAEGLFMNLTCRIEDPRHAAVFCAHPLLQRPRRQPAGRQHRLCRARRPGR